MTLTEKTPSKEGSRRGSFFVVETADQVPEVGRLHGFGAGRGRCLAGPGAGQAPSWVKIDCASASSWVRVAPDATTASTDPLRAISSFSVMPASEMLKLYA
jgi:hypothetical protein